MPTKPLSDELEGQVRYTHFLSMFSNPKIYWQMHEGCDRFHDHNDKHLPCLLERYTCKSDIRICLEIEELDNRKITEYPMFKHIFNHASSKNNAKDGKNV